MAERNEPLRLMSTKSSSSPDSPAAAFWCHVSPINPQIAPRSGATHTEALSRLLAEMQVVARAHPMGQW